MTSMIRFSRLVAGAAACTAALGGCDSIKDVRDEPYTDIPTATVVLQGTITGLGTRRPVVLRNTLTTPSGTTTAQYDFFGTADATESPFTFGSIPVGSSYAITVAEQPYAKVCTVNNGTATASATGPAVTVTCVNDATVDRFTVSGTISAAVAAIESAVITLTTEEGTRQLPAFGQTGFSFPDVIFDSRTSLPIFTWRVTATFTSPDGTVNNCAVSNGTNDAGDATVAPSGDITNVAVTACSFNIAGNVVYSTLPGVAASPIGANGVTLGLRDIATGEPVPGAPDVTLNAFSGSNVTLWPDMPSNPLSVYDVVVVEQPAQQTCVVRVTSGSGGSTTYHGTAVWLVNPVVPAQFQPTGVAVRCRDNPAAANQLAGTYLNIQRNADNDFTHRQFLTLFEEGTFLYSNHSSAGGNGVESGFYNWNPGTGQMVFTIINDTNGNAAQQSFSGMVGYSGGHLTVPASKTPAPDSTLTLSFTANLGSPATPTPVTWVMSEPKSVPGQMTGAWISPDHRRSWIFNFDDTTGTHFGVNGPVNMQAGCFVFDDGTAPSGYYTRRGGSTGCMFGGVWAGGFATYDVPAINSTTLPPGWLGKFPGAQSALDGRPPSPNTFSIASGTPDALTVQGSLNGVPVGSPVTFHRTRAN